MTGKKIAADFQSTVTAIQKAIAPLKNPDQKDAVLRACLSLNAPGYRAWLNCDPKPF